MWIGEMTIDLKLTLALPVHNLGRTHKIKQANNFLGYWLPVQRMERITTL